MAGPWWSITCKFNHWCSSVHEKNADNQEEKKERKRFIFNYVKQINIYYMYHGFGNISEQRKNKVLLILLIITNKGNNGSRLSRNTGGLALPIKAEWPGTTFQYNKYSKSHREFNLDQFFKNHAIKYEISKWYFIQSYESLKCQLRPLHNCHCRQCLLKVFEFEFHLWLKKPVISSGYEKTVFYHKLNNLRAENI